MEIAAGPHRQRWPQMNEINVGAMIRLKNAQHLITRQQYRTLRGQIMEGDPHGAMRGLRKLLLLQGSNAVKKQK